VTGPGHWPPPDVPPRIRPGLSPGGLYAAVIRAGLLVDGVAMQSEDLAGAVAERHADHVLGTDAWGVAIYDGDDGELVAVLDPRGGMEVGGDAAGGDAAL
jgi:hypothetical protein